MFITFIYFWYDLNDNLGYRRKLLAKTDRMNNALNNNLQEQISIINGFSYLRQIEKKNIKEEF